MSTKRRLRVLEEAAAVVDAVTAPAWEPPTYTVRAQVLDGLWRALDDGRAAYAVLEAVAGAQVLGWASYELWQWRCHLANGGWARGEAREPDPAAAELVAAILAAWEHDPEE